MDGRVALIIRSPAGEFPITIFEEAHVHGPDEGIQPSPAGGEATRGGMRYSLLPQVERPQGDALPLNMCDKIAPERFKKLVLIAVIATGAEEQASQPPDIALAYYTRHLLHCTEAS
jgi:hypothetical protein